MSLSIPRIRRPRDVLLCSVFAVALFVGCGGSSSDSTNESGDAASPSQNASTNVTKWDYRGERGPEAWGSLSSTYTTCSTGTAQSPVAIEPSAARTASVPALSFSYAPADVEVRNTGHSFNASPAETHTLTIGEDSYSLVQFHQHTPSEHTIDDTRYPIELHFVHKNTKGELAVIGVLAKTGEKSDAYQPFLQAANNALSSNSSASATVDLASLLPEKRSYYTYDGSLTTPPCTEGVRWIVLQQPVTISEGQIDFFAEAHGPSNRPTQPLGERTIRVSK